jgi:hypothetical protein
MNRLAWMEVGLIMGMMASQAGADPNPLTVKEIMGKLNKGPLALTPTIKRELQQDNPNWMTIQEQAKQYAGLAVDLPRNDPPKGDKSSWDNLAKQYAENAKALDEAARKQDKHGALAAHANLTSSCNACHEAHKN